MPKLAAKAVSKSSARSKWVPKGAEGQEGSQDRDSPHGEPEDAAVTSSFVLEPSTGPSYDRMQMVRVFELFRPAEKEAAASAPEAGTQAPKEGQPVEAVKVGLEDRPVEEEEGSSTPANSRRALREMKKAERAARRSSSGLTDLGEDASPVHKITLSQELQPEVQAGMMPIDTALLTYLNSMAWATAPMAPMYGGMSPGYTTVMLRNIPNRYTRGMLIERLNKGYEEQYDFVYLPIDFNSKCNVGYAFINFRSPQICTQFMQEFHGAKTKTVLPGFSSSKVCEVSYARVQGRDANMDNLRDEKFIEKLTERPEWQPLFLDDSGKEVDFSKMLSGGRKRSSRGSGSGYMMPALYGPMMYPPYPPPPPQALDSRALEMKMRLEAGSSGTGTGAEAADQGPATPSASSGQKQPAKQPTSPAAKAAGGVGFPPNVLGYPPPFPGFPAQAAAMAQMSVAMQQAHMNAHAAAAAHAGLAGGPPASPTHGSPGSRRGRDRIESSAESARHEGKPLGSEKKRSLRKQIEFYFSTGNLCKDLFLRSHMDAAGWTPMELIAQFPQVKKFRCSVGDVAAAMADSGIVEVDPTSRFMRLKDEEERIKWAKATAGPAVAEAPVSPAAR